MKKELLIPLAQYYTIDHVTPYTYIINKGGKYLYYFGSKHSYNPEDYQFEKIRYFFNDFVHHTTKENSIVLVEGGERPVALSEKEAMMEGAEMSFVTYLAYTADRVVTSPEIPDQMRFELMHAYFPKEEIVYYCFIQVCWQWNNTEMKIDFKKYIEVFLENDKKKSGWNDVDFSYEYMMTIHLRLFNAHFDPRDKAFLSSILDPRLETSIINKISAFDDSGLRDNYIINEIDKY